jgi:hypothetical protein
MAVITSKEIHCWAMAMLLHPVKLPIPHIATYMTCAPGSRERQSQIPGLEKWPGFAIPSSESLHGPIIVKISSVYCNTRTPALIPYKVDDSLLQIDCKRFPACSTQYSPTYNSM